ncbi:hypothetical protein BH09ACT4_BH09ACT4_03000 [soil metagenome]
MLELPSNFFADLIVAGVGALATVALALLTFLVGRSIAKTRALNLLVMDINERRAFVAKPERVRGGKDLDDQKWATESVLKCRDEISRTRRDYGFGRRVHRALDAMRRSCNHYLENTGGDPDGYRIHLTQLRLDLNAGIDDLARRPCVRKLEAGAASY